MQVLNQIKLSEAIGKKIVAVAVSYERHAIKYEDGSFSYFGRFDNWDSPEQADVILKYDTFIEKLNIRGDGSTWFTNTQELLIKIGVLDGDKLIEDAKSRIDAYVADYEKRELKELQRLTEKYSKRFTKGDLVTDDDGANIYEYGWFSFGKHYAIEGGNSFGPKLRKATEEESKKEITRN